MRFEECLDKGLIKKDPTASERVESSLMIAERFLRSSNRNLEIDEYEMAEMAAYNSAFHAARALLFAKGYTERSHFCLGVALRGLYRGKIIDLLKTFDKIRLSRHNVQYGGALVRKDEAAFVIEFAQDFLSAAKTELLTYK
ncbi:MAG: HEPN domain-containing protein [Methanotrichaceae archaeon]